MPTTYEWVSIGLSIISILIALFAFLKSNKLTKEYNSLVAGQSELQINERISDTKNQMVQISLKMPEESKLVKNPELKERYKKAMEAAIEDNLNAYEEACAKYIDSKVDKKRFEKTYRIEIRNLVEDANYKKYFDSITSRYKAILKVYKEWEDMEK